ncbi:MAG: HAD-IB family hydrolase [Candidatus Aminicenantes bacterium]|nr:HAD-IB family hydrolase [Candidatus Aminicenantes bacterium]
MPVDRMRLAVIDLDGTLLKGMTAERVFFLHLVAHGRIGLGRAVSFLLSFAGDLLRGGLQRAIGTNARFLSGETPETVQLWAREFGRVFLRKAVPDGLREKILGLKQDGCRVVLLSGSLQILVDELKERLGAEILIGGELEAADEKLTGRKTGIHPYGREKVAALYSRIDPRAVDWERSWALADRISDLPVLELVGNPVAVHPDRRLRRLARKRGWETIG